MKYTLKFRPTKKSKYGYPTEYNEDNILTNFSYNGIQNTSIIYEHLYIIRYQLKYYKTHFANHPSFRHSKRDINICRKPN